MIILEYLKVMSEIGFLVSATLVLLVILQTLVHNKKLNISERLKEMEEKQNNIVIELEKYKTEYLCNKNDIERLARSLYKYQETEKKYEKKYTEDQKILKDLDKRLTQCENQEKALNEKFQKPNLSSSIEKGTKNKNDKTKKMNYALMTSGQEPRKLKLKDLKPGVGEDFLFIESSDGAMVITSDRNNEICVIPDIEILKEIDFKYRGISQCFVTNRDVESGEIYKIIRTKECCVLEKCDEYYKVKEKGKIEITLF